MKKKPILSKNISIQEFNDWYWYKAELIVFCRENGLKTNGKKLEIKSRIEYFLEKGKKQFKGTININCKKSIKNRETRQILPKNINVPIPDNYTNSQLYREYFKSIIGPHFHFTAYMMKHIKEHPGITFKEYIDEWIAEDKRRKDKNYKPPIMKSCEYNQYIRDFFSNNSRATLNNAIECWNYKKNLPGNNKYSQDDLEILKKV